MLQADIAHGAEPRVVERCVAFVDLCGSSAFLERKGPRAATAMLTHARVVLRGAASEHGVRIVKWLGDGAMLCGASLPPVARCVSAAMRAHVDESPLLLRAGVCAGPMILFEGEDYVGAAVNLAARLCATASAGQALVDRASLTVGVPARAVPPVDVPGFELAIPVVELCPIEREDP